MNRENIMQMKSEKEKLGRYYKIRFNGGEDTNLPQNTDLQSFILVVSKKYQGTDYTI